MRVETMFIPPSSSGDSLRAILLRKLLLLGLIIIGVTVLLTILLSQIHTASSLLLIFLSDFMLGLISGFSSRLMFRNQKGFLRFFSACAAFLLGEFLLGFFTGWKVGIGPLKVQNSNVDWIGLGQLLLGIGTIVLTLEAWHTQDMEVALPAPKQEFVRAAPHARQRQPTIPRPARQSRRGARPKVQSTSSVAVAVPPKSKRRRIYHRKPQLQFSVEVEHRCPYCLEAVRPNDARGIVECKVCHTLHHADCWAITGTCQVPHLNN